MNAAARPLLGGGLIYCTSGYSGFQLFAVRPDGEGDITDSKLVWQFGKSVPSRSSPLMVGERLFMVGDAGVASCVDAKDGKMIWQKRLGGNFTSSPIFASGRIYLFDEEGKSYVIEAEPKYHELAVNHLDDGCMGSPAVSGNAMFVRTKKALYRIEQ